MSEPRFTEGEWYYVPEGDEASGDPFVMGPHGAIATIHSLIRLDDNKWVESDDGVLFAAAKQLYEAVVLARRVRETQKHYFRTHERPVLEQSLALERELDAKIKEALDRVHGVPTQSALFGGDA